MVRLTRASLARRTVVLLLTLLTIGLGVFATTALKQELIPSFDLPRGTVLTVYPGAAPDVVEAQISKPIESAVKAVSGVTGVTSKSSSGVSFVSINWDYGLNPDDMANSIRSAIDQLSGTLPQQVSPKVITGSFDDIPVMIVALSSELDLNDLSTQVTDTVVPALKTVPGVRDVSVAGQETHEITITYNQKQIEKHNLDPALIGQIFAANSTAIPSGTLRTDAENLDVQTGHTLASVTDIENLQIPTADGPVRLGEIATVVEQPVETTSISRVNGKTSLTLSITKDAGANTVSVSNQVEALLPQLETQLGHNAKFATVFNQAPYIEQSIHDLSVEGGIGLVMAVLVIMVFLGSIRPTLITAISIPLSLLIALIGLWLGGYSLNILTLGALTVAIGRVVDDSIVVIENIKRHQGSGQTGTEAILGAVKEVAGAVTSSTLTTVAVFAPIGLVGGQAGEFFRPFAFAVTVALLASLLVSLTVVPVLASWFMRPRQGTTAATQPSAPKDTWLQRAYLPVLNWSLVHRWLTLGIAAAIFGGTLALAPQLKTDFIGTMGTESLSITQKLPAGTGLATTDAAARQVERVLASNPAVDSYSTSIGGSTGVFMGSQADTNQASFTVPLVASADGKQVAAQLRHDLAELGPDAGTIEVSVGSGGPSATGVVVYVESSDSQLLNSANDKVLAMMKTIPGLTNVTSDLTEAREMLQVKVDAKQAAEVGMTRASVGQAVARSVRGQLIGTLAEGDTTLNVYLRSRKPVADVEQLRKIKLPVTQAMNAQARLDALDQVSKDSDKLQADGKKQSEKAFNEQVRALQKNKAAAKKSAAKLNSQLAKAKKQLKSLQQQLAALEQLPPEMQGPSVPASVFKLSQAVAGVSMQVAQLAQGVAAANGQAAALDKQLTSLKESRTRSLDAQDQQQEIQDASKDAQQATAKPIRLHQVAEVDLVKAPAMITRVDGVRAATISASSEAADLGATTALIKTGLADLNLPDGVTTRIGGVSQQQADSFRDLGLAMVIAVFAVYLIMVATFGSLLQPLVLLVSIPFAATGALGLSLVTDTALGVPSMIGLLMLIGIVVTNAIVLIDLINQKRRAGLGVDESIQAGARLRLRPIVMTALATIFALIPMSLGLTGGGVFISKPLAIVVIGGLFSSTLLTLILVPVLYDLLETWREKRNLTTGLLENTE